VVLSVHHLYTPRPFSGDPLKTSPPSVPFFPVESSIRQIFRVNSFLSSLRGMRSFLIPVSSPKKSRRIQGPLLSRPSSDLFIRIAFVLPAMSCCRDHFLRFFFHLPAARPSDSVRFGMRSFHLADGTDLKDFSTASSQTYCPFTFYFFFSRISTKNF